MPARNSAQRYGIVAQTLHWVVVALLIVQVTLGKIADELPLGLEKLAVLARHKSFGITILGLAVIRLAWRWLNRPPPLPSMPRWQHLAANLNHWALYALLFAMPLSGWMMSSASNYPVSWFGLVQLPDLIGSDRALKEAIPRPAPPVRVVSLRVRRSACRRGAQAPVHGSRRAAVAHASRAIAMTAWLRVLWFALAVEPGGAGRAAPGRRGLGDAPVFSDTGGRKVHGIVQELSGAPRLRPGRRFEGQSPRDGRDALDRHAGRGARRDTSQPRFLLDREIPAGGLPCGTLRAGRRRFPRKGRAFDPGRDEAGRGAISLSRPRQEAPS